MTNRLMLAPSSGIDVEAAVIDHLRAHLASGNYPAGDLNDVATLAIRCANADFRKIDARPRVLYMPNPPFPIDAAFHAGFDKLRAISEAGDDLTPHQSKTRLKADFHDHLLTDWGIHHFHLGTCPDARDSRFVARTGPVLFAFLTPTKFLALAIDQHGSWEEPRLLEVIHQSWPEAIARFRVPGTLSHSLRTANEIKVFRKSGINGVVAVQDGTTYSSPNVGRTLNGTPLAAVRASTLLVASIRQIQKHIDERFPQMTATIVSKRSVDPTLLKFRVAMVRHGEDRDAAFYLDELTTGYSFFLQAAP